MKSKTTFQTLFSRHKLRRVILPLLPLLILSCLFLNTVQIKAEAIDERIQDRAGILSTAEKQTLNEMIKEKEEDSDYSIYILTHNDSSATYPEEYIENIADQLDPNGSQIFFLYDLYRGEIFMEGYGRAESYIHSKRIDDIMDHMVDDLKGKNYFSAFSTYIEMTAQYMSDDSDINTDFDYKYDRPPAGTNPKANSSGSNVYNYDYSQYYDKAEEESEPLYFNVYFQIVAALIISLITIFIMIGKTSTPMTARGEDYAINQNSGLIGRRDQYIRTSVTRVRRPKENTSQGGSRPGSGFNSGGSRGGVSSGGRSHSSGGRKL